MRHSLLAVTGSSGSGKTSLILRLLPLLQAKGYRPACIKHSGHHHNFDNPAKDSGRFFAAGAAYSLIGSDESHLLHCPKPLDLAQLPLCPEADLLLLEGWKNLKSPRIQCLLPNEPPPEPSEDLLAIQCQSQEQAQALNQVLGKELAFSWEQDAALLVDRLLPALTQYYLKHRPLKVALMAGGKSSRMGTDKALLDYGRGRQLEALSQLVHHSLPGIPLLLSCRNDQGLHLPGVPLVADQVLEAGPLGGLLSLFLHDPNCAWMVLGVDLACLGPEAVLQLKQQRNPLKLISYLQREDIEPLAAIYEPASLPLLRDAWFHYHLSLKRVIGPLPCQAIPLEVQHWPQLFNVNHPDEVDQARAYWRGKLANH